MVTHQELFAKIKVGLIYASALHASCAKVFLSTCRLCVLSEWAVHRRARLHLVTHSSAEFLGSETLSSDKQITSCPADVVVTATRKAFFDAGVK